MVIPITIPKTKIIIHSSQYSFINSSDKNFEKSNENNSKQIKFILKPISFGEQLKQAIKLMTLYLNLFLQNYMLTPL